MIGRLDTGGKVREEIVEVKVVGNKPARRANSPSGLPTKTIKHKHRDIQGGNLQIIENFGRRKSPLTKKEVVVLIYIYIYIYIHIHIHI